MIHKCVQEEEVVSRQIRANVRRITMANNVNTPIQYVLEYYPRNPMCVLEEGHVLQMIHVHAV